MTTEHEALHPRSAQGQAPLWSPALKAGLAVLLLLWFAAAAFIGTEQLLVNRSGGFLPPIAITAVLPVVLFLALYGLSARFRGFMLAQDLRTLTLLQMWRVIGFTFLPLLAIGALPGLFAWPAGLGDVAVGLGAVYVVARLDRDADYAASAGFLRFHLLGLLDFAVAVGTAGLAAGAFPALIPGGVTSAPMDVWPLNLFPSFGVPIFIILHLTVLFKVRQLRRTAGLPAGLAPEQA